MLSRFQHHNSKSYWLTATNRRSANLSFSNRLLEGIVVRFIFIFKVDFKNFLHCTTKLYFMPPKCCGSWPRQFSFSLFYLIVYVRILLFARYLFDVIMRLPCTLPSGAYVPYITKYVLNKLSNNTADTCIIVGGYCVSQRRRWSVWLVDRSSISIYRTRVKKKSKNRSNICMT